MQEGKKKLVSILFYTLTFILGLIVGAAIFYILEDTGATEILRQSSQTESENNGEENSQDDSTPNTTTVAYEGTYISGEIPQGWSIVEYTDNSGSDTLMDNTTYSGLVGLKIFNENNVEMFYLKAMDGIGGTQGCDTVYEFSDSDQAYIDHGNDWTLEVGTVPSNVVDLTNSTYTEYEVFGWEVRRVGTELYRDINPIFPGFNPACGIDKNLTIHNLAYYRQLSAGITMNNTYYMAISSTVDTTQLEQLDSVLESLTVN